MAKDKPCYLNGTMIVAKFRAGTQIQSEESEIAIENLKEGDLILTTSGQYEPVKWVGHFSQTIDVNEVEGVHESYPVRIRKGAFADNQPKRDLYVSQLHSLWVDGILVPAIDLVNDLTITIEPQLEVTYYHVELNAHSIIYADGMTAETYLDDNNREIFITDTGPINDVTTLHPEMPSLSSAEIWKQKGYAIPVRSGPQLDLVRANLLARAESVLNVIDQHKERTVVKAA